METVTLSYEELDRVSVIERVIEKRLSSTMDLIREKQRRRAEKKIAKPFTTLRDARLLRGGVPRRTTPSTSPETPL
jgi:hypothetical protein